MFTAAQNPLRCAGVLGFRTAEQIILTGEFDRLCQAIDIATDDGTFGYHGTIINPLINKMRTGEYVKVCACGPLPMLRAVSEAAAEYDIPCEVSLEQRMACGVGACLGCAVRITDSLGHVNMAHVCKDGPVFDAKAVIWQ